MATNPETQASPLTSYILQLADNALILGHRLSEWCGHAPALEEDIALTNIALDLIGQAREWYQYAGEIESKAEDDYAYQRPEHLFRNLLLVEQPNEDFAYTIVRQFFFDAFNFYLHQQLQHSTNQRIAEIAEKSLKEITYHLRHSSEWVIRLGDGTPLSHQKMQTAIDELWMFVGEMFLPSPADRAAESNQTAPQLESIGINWHKKISEVLQQATLRKPTEQWTQSGGKNGTHTEHLGYILAEMQYLPKTYPGAKW